ncbi:hypothetical protein B0A55_01795 [Friedmanniomyces simplex]|uniref:VLRF1 domain-containing protein n=1 Tax=Friedmanniomyces simplex TaxID=329884 RepID=A0A4U0XYA6_9PEZI|nr:hypothetical protein B0A55_01795 [Friedmanniomyces simplex]
MAQQAGPVDKLLQRPLYIFDLPEELLYTLQLKVQSTAPVEAAGPGLQRAQIPNVPSVHSAEGPDESSKAATTCSLCGLTFTSLQEQRSHVRSDLHGYNLKQKLRGKKPVDEAEFERLVGQLDESISGSDSSDSEEDDEDGLEGTNRKETTLSALLKRQAKVTHGDAEDAPAKRKRGSGKPPILWFDSSKLPSNTSLGVYRAIFSAEEQDAEDHLVETVKRKQLAPKPPPPPPQQRKHRFEDDEDGGVPLPVSVLPKNTSASGPHYFLCMIGGGHFAAMLVSLTPKLTKKAGVEDRTATGAAHSAGSSLRRYNEAALTQEVRDLLSEWRNWIDSAELLFIRATGSTNRRTLLGPYDGQVLSHKDGRLRGFPFNTRRATQSELMRAFVELTRVQVNTVDEAALAKQAEEAAAAAAKAEAVAVGKANAPKPAKPSKAEEEAILHTTQLQALIRRSKAPAMLSYIQSHRLSPDFRFVPYDHHAPTPLHLAAASNSPACVTALLLKAGADPTVCNDDGTSAFTVAGDRATRDAFRLARSQLGEDRWKWEAAGIPPPLTQAEVDQRAAREKEEKSAEEAAEKQRRQAEMERIRKEDAEKQAGVKEKKFGRGQHLMQQPVMTAEERRREEAKGMTNEMRMRLEREKRARAAEERMKRLQGR